MSSFSSFFNGHRWAGKAASLYSLLPASHSCVISVGTPLTAGPWAPLWARGRWACDASSQLSGLGMSYSSDWHLFSQGLEIERGIAVIFTLPNISFCKILLCKPDIQLKSDLNGCVGYLKSQAPINY